MFILIVMCVGIVIGKFFFPKKHKRKNEIFQIICTILLIFSMGAMLGGNGDFFDQLLTLGWESFLFFFIPSVCSLFLVYFLSKRFLPGKNKKRED